LPKPLSQIRNDVELWIGDSGARFQREFVETDKSGSRLWVLKYIPARFVASFCKDRRLVVSTTPGFTWGDGIYVVPLRFPYSSMMYGRIGVMGWVDAAGLRVYDATRPRGIELYQEWIQTRTFLYRLLTTTIHSERVNRVLRNLFRREFEIHVVSFAPDQFNVAYVEPTRDRWLCISDWSGAPQLAPGQRPIASDVVRECEWVAVVTEEFEKSPSQFFFRDLIGPSLVSGPRHVASRPDIVPALRNSYQTNRANRTSGAQPPSVLLLRP